MYIRYNTQTNHIIYIGQKKPLNVDTDLLKVVEYNGEIPKNDWLTVEDIQEKTRVLKESYDETIEFDENGMPLQEPQTIHHEAVIENYLECTELVAHFKSAEEKARLEKVKRIAELKRLLSETDYQAIKFAEGWLTAEEYEPIKVSRQSYRNEINQLENGTV